MDHETKALSDIDTFGCHVIHVFAEADLPCFTYSVGIQATSGQPELIVLGLRQELAHWIVNEYNRRVRAGETFVANKFYSGFLEGFPVLFSPFLREHYAEYLGWDLWLYRGGNFRAHQLIWPSTLKEWPWQDEAGEEYKRHMPLLCQRPDVAMLRRNALN